MEKRKPLLVLFDGNAIVHRAYHAFQATNSRAGRTLTVSRTGEIVSAVYGFAQMLLKVLSELKPTHYAIAFDKKGPTFRHHLYEEYKAHRPATPDELVRQLGRVKELVKAFHIPIFEIDKFEADDVLGTLSEQASREGIDTVIITGDADTMQLVSPQVKVLYPRPGRTFSDTMLYGEEEVNQKYGVTPEHVPDLKGLVGDPSDNIPGVSGIGGKTAARLIQQFGGIDDIYKHIDEVEPARLRELLIDNEEIARKSRELATIVRSTPVVLDLDECRVSHYDRNRVVEMLRELEFNSLLSKLPDAGAENVEVAEVAGRPPEGDYKIVADVDGLDALLSRLSSVPAVAVDTETTSVNPMLADLVGISMSPAPGEAYYIPVGHVILDEIKQLPLAQVIERLKRPMEDNGLVKYAHNAKYDLEVLAGCGLEVKNLNFDSMVAAYLLGEKSLSLKALAFSKLGFEMTPISELIGKGSKQLKMSEVDIKRTGEYACADADMTRRLSELLEGELRKQNLWELFTGVEMPLVPVLIHMEESGITLSTDRLQEMSRQLGAQLNDIEQQIYSYAGKEFNINSPLQLGKVLFDDLHCPTQRRGKGRYSTEASVLEGLRKDYPIVNLVMQYRQLTKIKSTYIDALPVLVNTKTGRLHTSFNQTRTTTGRLSSSDPNLQNIPVRGELGGQVRQAFIAPEGYCLLAGDYSQIDLRALAHLSQDSGLLSAFKNDEDIHAATASLLFGVPASEITPDMRRLAKTVNFGVIYGMSDYGLEQATELSRAEAAQFITNYFEKYPGVKEYLEATRQHAREKGYVETVMGRRRFIPDINSANRQVREAAERMAINMPVQGTSADIIKMAMINLYNEMGRWGLKSRMLLQVHDELIFEVPDSETETMRHLVPEVMSRALELSVPLRVDIKAGRNWGEMR